MLDSGLKPDVIVFNSLITAAARSGDAVAAEAWFDETAGHSVDPDIVSYNSLIQAHSRAGDLARAEQRFKGLVGAGHTPYMASVSPILTECANRGDVDKAEYWRDAMSKRGIQTTDFMYNQLVLCYGRATPPDIEKVELLVRDMARSQVSPTSVTVAAIKKVVGKRMAEELLSGVKIDMVPSKKSGRVLDQRRRLSFQADPNLAKWKNPDHRADWNDIPS
eukprot:UN1673